MHVEILTRDSHAVVRELFENRANPSAARLMKKLDGSISIIAPAKINLRLKIEGRREDGYHLLSMLNCRVDLSDLIKLDFRPGRDGIQLRVENCEDPALRDVRGNLASRAAACFLEEFGIDQGMEISIEKRIPVGAGLGGGSSDAAAVLRALHSAFGTSLAGTGWDEKSVKERLERIALKLGSDVPFFLSGAPAACVKGIGEKVLFLSMENLSGMECLLVLLPVSISTKSVFDTLRHRRPDLEFEADADLADFIEMPPVNRPPIASMVFNDLEEVVCDTCEALRQVLLRCRKMPGVKAGMSGSGSSLFIIPAVGKKLPKTIYQEVESLKKDHQIRPRQSLLSCDFKKTM